MQADAPDDERNLRVEVLGVEAEKILWGIAPRYLTWRAFTDSYPELTPSALPMRSHVKQGC